MTYTNAEKLVKTAHQNDSADNLRKLLNALGSPERRFGIIKIFGESGKSSVTSMVSALLNGAGYRVGRLTTPVIGSIPDSLCVYEKSSPIKLFLDCAEKVYRAIVEIRKGSEEDADFSPSRNDLLYAIAFIFFAAVDCDVAVIEIPTENSSHTCFSSTALSVITSVHSEVTARRICARLDRNGKEIVSSMQEREIHKLISNKCAEINSRLTMPLRNSFVPMVSAIKHSEFSYGGRTYCVGCGAGFQIENLLTVLEASEALKRCGFKIAGTDICQAVLSKGIPLCFETVAVMPTVIVDRADTKERRCALIESLKALKENISRSPFIISECDKEEISSEFLAEGFEPTVSECDLKALKKTLREHKAKLDTESTLLILGNTEFCESGAKLIREILM